MRIGIVGAGLVARGVAELAVRAGHEVMVSNSRGPASLADLAAAVGAVAGTVDEAIAFGDTVLIAIPFNAIATLPADALAGKVVLDAGNYYPERDGQVAELDDRAGTTTGMLARHLPRARIVKAFNAILARDLAAAGHLPGSSARRALPIAGDDAAAKQAAAGLHEAFGFDVVDAGSVADSWRFERAKPAYCVPLDAAGLRRALAAAERDVEVEEGSWRR